jgi:hypothetical protein
MRDKYTITKYVATAIVAILLLSSSCKKTNDSPTVTPNPTPAPPTLGFHIHTDIDTHEVVVGDTVYTADKRKMTLTVAELYISGIKLYKTSDGSEVNVDGYILKTMNDEQYQAGSFPAGNYSTVSFNVGLDASVNHKDPSTFATGNPLAKQTLPMWFGSTDKGYIFLNIKGFIDTSAAKNGKANFPFSYQVGSDALLTNVKMPDDHAFTAYSGKMSEVHLLIDYSALLKGLNMKTENMADPTSNPTLCAKVAKNIPHIFRYEM